MPQLLSRVLLALVDFVVTAMLLPTARVRHHVRVELGVR